MLIDLSKLCKITPTNLPQRPLLFEFSDDRDGEIFLPTARAKNQYAWSRSHRTAASEDFSLFDFVKVHQSTKNMNENSHMYCNRGFLPTLLPLQCMMSWTDKGIS